MVAKPCLDSAALPRLGRSVRGDAALTITKVIGFRWDLGDEKSFSFGGHASDAGVAQLRGCLRGSRE